MANIGFLLNIGWPGSSKICRIFHPPKATLLFHARALNIWSAPSNSRSAGARVTREISSRCYRLFINFFRSLAEPPTRTVKNPQSRRTLHDKSRWGWIALWKQSPVKHIKSRKKTRARKNGRGTVRNRGKGLINLRLPPSATMERISESKCSGSDSTG